MKANRWRMLSLCDTCPFQLTGPGAKLRRSLRPGRMAEIKRSLRAGSDFMCHKTTRDGDDDDADYVHSALDRLCAGAIAYQDAQGVSSQYRRIAERLS